MVLPDRVWGLDRIACLLVEAGQLQDMDKDVAHIMHAYAVRRP